LIVTACENGIRIKPDTIIYVFSKPIGLDGTRTATKLIKVVLTKTLDGIRTAYPDTLEKYLMWIK